jgi:pyruvate dehydrogenase (quinone)
MDRRPPRRRAALAAAGQAKLTGRLGVCCGTTGPGSTHLVAGLYEASRDHAPVLGLSGEMPRKMEGTDYFQATDTNLLFRDVSLYTETISSPAQAPAVIHQAIAAAYAGPGVAHLTLPQDVINAKADGSVSSVATLKPRSEIVASEADIAEIARRIDEAGSIVIMCGAGCHGAGDELRALSDRLKAPLIHSVKGKDIMPYDDPRWMGGIGMIGTKADYHAVMHCELFLMLGTDYPYSEFLPRESVVIQVDERAQVIGRRAPTELGVNGSVRPTVKSLLDRVKTKNDTAFFDRVTAERKAWDEKVDKQSDPARSKDRIHPQAVARMVSDLANRDAVFVIDTGLNTLWSGNWIRQSGQQRIIGSFNNGAVGTALGQANGVQALDRSRQVIALCGDGGFNMLMCEFLTAVQHKLPVKAVVYDNFALGLIVLEAEAIGVPAWKRPLTSPIRITWRWRAPAAAWASKPKSLASCARPSTRRSRRKARPLSIAWLRPTNCPTSPILSSRRWAITPRQRSRKQYSQLRAGDEGTAIALSSGRDGKGFRVPRGKRLASAATEAHMTGHLRAETAVRSLCLTTAAPEALCLRVGPPAYRVV